ncbi:MAG: hypothetical protein JWM44_1334 [Bacilli bacterium]|nr:hypothetical protein [Bacilli bacterium]
MGKEPWVYGKGYLTRDEIDEAFKSAIPKIKKDFDDLMNKELPEEFQKLFK